MQYAVVIEHSPGTKYSACVPDLPGCFSTGDTIEEAGRNILEAIRIHLEGMRQDSKPIPGPTIRVTYTTT